jgi:hypothetical protein
MVLSSAMGAYATTPGPVQTAPQDLSQTQLAQVRKVLTDGGLPAAAVEAVMADRTQVAQIPVASSGEETHGAEAVPSGSGFAAPATMGSVCTGYGAWVQRKQYVRNVYNGILAWAALRTDFCYNNSRVTYTNSTRTHGVTALGSPTLNWNGWDDLSEGWYLYNGRTYGGVKSTTQGNFNECIVKYGCFTTDTLTMRTYAHYDGTSSASGSSY